MFCDNLLSVNSNNSSLCYEQQNKNRQTWLDVLKGIGIILVIYGHVYQNEIFVQFVYAFHMPLFFVAAGWLYKEYDVIYYVRHKFYTVLIPYYSFGMITIIYWQIIERRFRSSEMSFGGAILGLIRGQFDYLDFNVHLWFLPCFFLTVVIYNYLRKILGKRVTFVIVLLMSLTYIFVTLPPMFYCFDWVFKYIGFYAIGNVLAECNKDKVIREWWWLIIAGVLLVIVFVMTCYDLNNGIGWFIVGTLGTIALMICSMLVQTLNERNIILKLLEFCGKGSLLVLCIHGPVYRVLIKLFAIVLHINTDGIRENFFFSMIVVIFTLIICSIGYLLCLKIFPWMIGKPVKKVYSSK